jgi:hypothetical protein
VSKSFFFFILSSFLFLQAREAAKSGLVLFHEAMEEFDVWGLEKSFKRFERAAAKGHEESIWITSVVKDVEMEESAVKEAFAKTEEPLGWYFVGELSDMDSREQFDFWKKSAEGGCSWGQVSYGAYFAEGYVAFVEKEEESYLEWLEKAANQNNPWAMEELGHWFRNDGGDKEKCVSHYRAAAELGWKNSMFWVAKMLRDGDGCVKDFRQAVIWSAKGDRGVFWKILEDARRACESRATEDLDCDFNQLCFSLGWGLYWNKYETEEWKYQGDVEKAFGKRCVDFYCSCVELQQKSIFTFLLFWNRTASGVKEPGKIIAQMVWEGKGTNVLLRFGEKREKRGCILF